ncbi:beta strand repeat-containing protein [Pseudomonadota bacterium]
MRQFMRMRFIKRSSVFSFTTISFFLLLGTLFASTANAQLVSQITVTDTICGGDLVSYGNCTAGEISLATISGTVWKTPLDTTNQCVLGESITALNSTVTYDINTQQRYDLLMWIGEQQGTDPRAPAAGDPNKSCLVLSLPGPFNDNPLVFTNLEGNKSDQCGDIDGGVAAAQEQRTFSNVSFECQDNDSDGKADIQVLLSWSQNTNQFCGLGVGERFPTAGAGSKCDFETVNSTLDVLQPSSLTLIKNTLGGDGTFDFTFNKTSGTNLPAGTSIGTAGGTGQAVFNFLSPQTDLSIVENLPSGWDTTNIVCAGATNNGTFADDASSPQISGIQIAEGEDVICTVSNTKLASLTVVKNTAGGNGVFEFTANNGIGAFQLDTGANNTASTAPFENLQPGNDYSITETIPANWELSSASCNNGSGTLGLNGALTGINLQPGAAVTCTFNNVRGGVVSISKLTDGGDGTFDFTTGAGLSDFSLTTTGGSSPPFAGVLSAGTYRITEDIKAGWDLTDLNCTESLTQDTTVDLPSRTITLNVQDGESINCTVTNQKHATLTIEKQTLPNGDPTSFTFTGDVNGSVIDGGSLSLTRSSGLFNSEETVPAGWGLSNIACAADGPDSTWAITGGGGADNVFVAGDTIVNAMVAPGEEVSCVYTNTKLAQLTVVKHISATGPAVQDFGFTSDLPGFATFTLSPVDVATDDQLVVSNLTPGTYGVGEDPPGVDGWALTGASCGDGSPVTAIDLAAGENLTCTFTNSPLGSTTIIKNTVGGDDIFDFVGDDPIGIFDLDTTPSRGTASADFTNILPAGTYDVVETLPPAGWELTAVDCVDDQTDNSSGDLGSATATIDVDLGETVTCTFVNTSDGALIIRKQTFPDQFVQDFTFSGTSPDLTGTLQDYDIASAELSLTGQPGFFETGETVPAGWSLTDISCTGATNSTVNYNGSGGSPANFEPGDDTVSVDIAAGETVICTFTNTKQGSLTIVKNTEGGDGSFVFNHDVPNAASPFVIDTALDNTNLLSTTLLPGSYMVSEVIPTGWDLSLIACTGNTDSTITIGGAGGFDPGDNAVTVDMRSGEDIVCTFTNTQQGKILVDKVTDPTGSPQSFDFTPSWGAGFSLTDAAPANDSGLLSASSLSGNYSVSEAALAGWDLTSAICTGAGNTPAAINLQPGETVTCTFTNTIQPGQIIVDKQTAPTGVAQLFDFTLTGTGVDLTFQLADASTPFNSGNLLPTSENGTYNVAETVPTDWTQISATCSDGSSPAAVNLSPGEVVTCTFVNSEAGTSTFTKVSVGGDDTFSFTSDIPGGNFSLTTVNGISPVSPVSGLTAGTYTITENVLAGWDLTDLVCTESDIQDSVTDIPTRTITLNVQEGETINCTVTNTKQGSITVSKVTVPSGDPAQFAFTGDAAGSIGDGGTITVPNLPPGTYTSVEGALAGWDLTGIQCDDGASTIPSTGEVGTLTATFNLDAGEDVICAFTNTLRADINLAKTVVGSAVLETNGTYTVVYSITATNAGGPGMYDLVDAFSPGSGITLNTVTASYLAGSEDSQNGTLGAYPNFVTGESLAGGLNESWTVTANFTITPVLVDPVDSQCDPTEPAINTGFYNAVSGSDTDTDLTDNATCTGLPFATLTVMKQVNGGSALPSDFVLTLTGADGVNDGGVDYMSGDQPPVKVGIEYLLTETPDQVPDYLDGGVSCTDNAGNTPVPYPVTLTAGQSITCTQVNNFRGEPVDVIAVPVNDKLALLLLTLMLLASGWYFRPATMRK